MGLCLLMGYAGQVSLGHGAFFAIGGYTSAVLTTHDFSAFKAAAWAGWLQQAHLLVAKQDLYGNATLTVSPWAAFLAAMLVTFLIAAADRLSGAPPARPLPGHGHARLWLDRQQDAPGQHHHRRGRRHQRRARMEAGGRPDRHRQERRARAELLHRLRPGPAVAGVAAQPRPLPRRARACRPFTTAKRPPTRWASTPPPANSRSLS